MKKITFYKRIYIRYRLKKNVPNCSSVTKNIGDLLRVITALLLLRPAEPILFTYRIMARATTSILKLTNKYGHDPLH
jgi:hypothetical protein